MRIRMDKAGVLMEYRGWSVEAFGIDEKDVAWGRGFFLAGKQGSGKSCLAGALVRNYMLKNPKASVGWRYAPDVPRIVMDSWGGKGSGEGKAMQELLRNSLLVIDDLGSEKHTTHTIPIVREVVEKTINNGRMLVVTSNLSLADFARHDQRLASRLSMLQRIDMPDIDYRARAARKRPAIQARILED